MRLRWTATAARDLTVICDYIREHDSAAAHRVALSSHERVSALREFPERGRVGRKLGTRDVVFTGLPYLAVYRVQADAVEILRILHGARVGEVSTQCSGAYATR
jgi:toxin ParE1/3/4